ncbi:hypothetical protein HY479_03880 [Candidatus Uhrbacteria bacterium]|nr:hypothetical protein [Candidatus Uhrbacteria bacterium]
MSDAGQTFKSNLPEGRQRFLSEVIVHGLDIGIRDDYDFVRNFSPLIIMEGLKNEPKLRARILCPTTNLMEEVALRARAEDAATLLLLALEVREDTAAKIVAHIHPDDRVLFLPILLLWNYHTESGFWKPDAVSKNPARSKQHLQFMLECALANGLVTHQDIVDGVGFDTIASRFPNTELAKLLRATVTAGRQKGSYADRDLLETTPASVFVEHIPLDHIWENVIGPKVAQAHGFIEPPPPAEPVLELTDSSDDEDLPEEEGGDDAESAAPAEATASDAPNGEGIAPKAQLRLS